MIEVKELEKRFGEAAVLNKLSFKINKGEIVGFLGPNGAGKSTTMKILTTFLAPTAGQVKIDDLDVTEQPIKVRAKIGYLPEMVPLYDDMLVSEYLRFVAGVRQIPSSQLASRLQEVVEACGLEKVVNQPIDELSKGYRQRVGLAQSIIHDPEILILDEPTTGLDPNQIVEIRELIKKLGKEKTVIFSTHILSEVSATCDRVIIINNGRIVGEGTPAELAQRANANESIYLKLVGPRTEIEEKIKALTGLKGLSLVEQTDQFLAYEISAENEVDLRPGLTKIILEAGWSLLEINKKSSSLEDIFRELTK